MGIKRRKSREVKIGSVKIGGTNPIAVQSMVKRSISDLGAALRQIKQLQAAGSQIIRVAIKDRRDAANLKAIKKGTNIPLVADIHFDKNLALAAIDSGVDKIRLNPGNIHKPADVREIARAAGLNKVAIRVGVNSGSVAAYASAKNKVRQDCASLMVSCALDYIKLLEDSGFSNIVISLKSPDISTTFQANQEIAKSCDYPLHLGLTATGPYSVGVIKSSIALGGLLNAGIGDTIRISLTDEPLKEVKAAYGILAALGLIRDRIQIISCPTCGRCQVNLVRIVKNLERKLPMLSNQLLSRPMKLAVMGCEVNGPGEAREADLGVAFGKKQGLLFKKGRPIRKISADKCVDELLYELKELKGSGTFKCRNATY